MIKPFRKYVARSQKDMVETATLHILNELKENRYPYAYCKEIAKKLDEYIDLYKDDITKSSQGELYEP